MTPAVRSFAAGLWTVLRAPILVIVVVVTTMAAAAPFGAVLGSRLQEALANQPPIALGSRSRRAMVSTTGGRAHTRW